MTHFTVAIIIPPDKLGVHLNGFIARQMHPYDEDIMVDAYVCYSVEQAAADIESERKRLEKIIRTKEPGYDIGRCHGLLEKLAATTPEARYRERISHHELFNDCREPLSTYNPESKWDWYVIGGRWDGWINDLETSGERAADNMATTEQMIERGKIPHAIITPDGEWHEHGRMGWWAILLTENENWDAEARAILASYPSHQLVIIDAHI